DRPERPATLQEVVELAARLQRRPRLGGAHEERALTVELLVQAADRVRMRRVEDVEALDAEAAAEHLGREARAAHTEQDDVIEVAVETLQLVEPLEHPPRLVEPAEPARLVASGPDRGVARPDAVDQLDGFQRAHCRNSSTSRSNS